MLKLVNTLISCHFRILFYFILFHLLCFRSVERYNPEKNSWTRIADMISRRSGAGVGVLENVLYAVGGHDGPLVRKSCEKYSSDTDTWSAIAGE